MSERVLWRLAKARIIRGYSLFGNTMAQFRLFGRDYQVVLKQPQVK